MREGARRLPLALAAVVALALLALVLLQLRPSGSPAASAGPSPGSTAAGGPTATAPPATPGSGTTTAPSSGAPSAATTAAPSPTEFDPALATATLVGAGDIADCGSDLDTETAAIVEAVPGTVFTLGDNAYEDGTLAEFERCYAPTWGRFLDRTRPAPGNHEYRTAGAAGYFDYFGDRAGPDRRGYYAYDAGAWRIYSLNSQCDEIGGCGAGSDQFRWLLEDLEEHPSRCTLAYWHHPRYSSGEHGNNASMDEIWDALFDAGLELALAGHDHSYERFAPMNKDGDLAPERGITSFVVGTGGRRFYEFEDVLPTSRARVSGVAGVLELTLRPGAWSARFIPVLGGRFTDRAQDVCH